MENAMTTETATITIGNVLNITVTNPDIFEMFEDLEEMEINYMELIEMESEGTPGIKIEYTG